MPLRPATPAEPTEGSERTVYLMRSHTWLHTRLFENAVVPPEIRLVGDRAAADVIVYPEPPWPDHDAPESWRDLSPRELLRTYVFVQRDDPVPWAPGVYTSLRRRRGPIGRAFTGGFYVPPPHLRDAGGLSERLNEARTLQPDLLWSFVGTTKNAHVRARLFDLGDNRAVVEDTARFNDTLRWGWATTHRDEARRAFDRYATVLGRSKFVVCPRGRGLSSLRLFEVMEAGRCPVIVSDGWLPPPFVDWPSCALRVTEGDVDRLPAILRKYECDSDRLGRNARLAWERFFAPERQLVTLARACLALDARVGPGTRALVPIAVADRTTLHWLARRGKHALRDRLGGARD